MQSSAVREQTFWTPLKSIFCLTNLFLIDIAEVLNCNYKYPSNAVISKLSVYFFGKGNRRFTEGIWKNWSVKIKPTPKYILIYVQSSLIKNETIRVCSLIERECWQNDSGSQTGTRWGLLFWLKSSIALQSQWDGWCLMLWLSKVAERVVMWDPMLERTCSTHSISRFNIFRGYRNNNNAVFFPCFVLIFWFIYQPVCGGESARWGLQAVTSRGLAFIVYFHVSR